MYLFGVRKELESDGSSSKEYWKQFMEEEEEESVLYLTLTTQMRRMIEMQTFSTLPLEKSNNNIEDTKLILDPPLQTRTHRTYQTLLTTSNFYCIS
jgi:hypothetical protein